MTRCVCGRNINNCDCPPGACKTCKLPTKDCVCCSHCKLPQEECECCQHCRQHPCSCNQVSQSPVNTRHIMSQTIEPPDISCLKESKENLDFYIDALEAWSECGGYQKSKQADVVFMFAFKQYPDLCREMQSHFKKSLRGKEDGVEKIINWLKEKIGLVKHADVSRILRNFQSLSRPRNQDLMSFVSEFEKAYDAVVKVGETFTATTRAIFMLHQANLSDTDHHLITVNINLQYDDKDKDKHFDLIKQSMRKFQDLRTANGSHVNIGHQCRATDQAKVAYLAGVVEEEDIEVGVERRLDVGGEGLGAVLQLQLLGGWRISQGYY